MQMCDSHWTALKAKLEELGLAHLIVNQEQLKTIVTDEVNGETPENWCPLFTATMQIYGEALRAGGLYMMMGSLCPLCEVAKHLPPTATGQSADNHWIDGCCTALLERARAENRVAKVQ